MAKNMAIGMSSGSDSAQNQSYGSKPAKSDVMGKEKKDGAGAFAKGGTQHMLTGMTAGPQEPGQSASEGKSSSKFASGGGTKDVGPQFAGPQEPGVAGHTTKGDGGKFAAGGKGPDNHMFGPQTAKTASPA